MALNYVSLSGSFDDGSGNPLNGAVTFSSNVSVYAGGVPLVTPDTPITAQIVDGQLRSVSGGTLQLLATDNSGLSYIGQTGFFYWTVAITLSGQVLAPWGFFLPHASLGNGPVDLYSLANTAAGSSGFVNPMTAAGDLIDGGTAGAAQRLAIGSTGQVLTVSGGAPVWQSPSPALPLTTLGDTLYENGTPAPARLAGSTSATKNFLTQTGTGSVSAAPAWGTIAAGDLPTVPVTSGGTGQTTQQAAIDALAGAQTSGDYLRGNGSHVVMSPIQAADVPQLSQYNPVGLTGATTPTSYAGGTVSGHPLSGTWSQGQWVVDETGKIYVCVTGGTPGTWRRVGAMPYQFFLDDYCKGDGQQALVSTTNANATINTTPLSAPAAPALSNSGSSGSLTAGTYQVKVTYTNRWGETVASSSSSVAISGTEPLTITAPALSGNATGWYAYVTQAGGSTYYRQQASGSPTAMGLNLVLTANPTTSGANPPGADSSAAQIFTSTAVDGGKNVMVCGGLGTPGGPWIDTISVVNSPTSATLSTASAAGNFTGCPMVFSSDDRLNVDACISAATAYALANDNFCQVIGSDRIYGLGSGLFQSSPANGTGTCTYNTALRIPFGNPSGNTQKLEFQLLGPGDQDNEQFWMSQYANFAGCAFVSYSIGPNSTPDPTYGQQSVIGGPLGGFASGSNGFANVKAVILGVQTWQPGWSNSIGIDLLNVASLRVRASSFGFAPASSLGGAVNPYNGWPSASFWVNNKIAAGLRLPQAGANQDSIVESFAAGGLNTCLISSADGAIISNLIAVSCDGAVKLNLGSSAHDLVIGRFYFENCNGGIIQPGGGINVGVYVTMDGENATLAGNDIHDVGNQMFGVVRWRDQFRTGATPSISGGANLKIVNDMLSPGHWASPPAVPATTVAQQNTAWRDASIVLHTGSGVTVSSITIDGTVTGLTMAASSSLALPVLPGGKNITLAYAGGTPTWDWWLA